MLAGCSIHLTWYDLEVEIPTTQGTSRPTPHETEPLCKNVGELHDFLAFLVLAAPDNFPAWRNLDLESAFQKLDLSVDFCAAEFGQPSRVAEVKAKIFEALEVYRGGNSANGAIMLQQLMHSL